MALRLQAPGCHTAASIPQMDPYLMRAIEECGKGTMDRIAPLPSEIICSESELEQRGDRHNSKHVQLP